MALSRTGRKQELGVLQRETPPSDPCVGFGDGMDKMNVGREPLVSAYPRLSCDRWFKGRRKETEGLHTDMVTLSSLRLVSTPSLG